MRIMKQLLHILYQPYKWLIFLPLFLFGTVFFVCIGIIVLVFFDDRMANRTAGVWWARFNAYITPVRVLATGREYVKKGRSYIVVANHQSLFDILVLYGWLGFDLKWVMKKELRRIPVFGYAGEKGGNIYIDRSNPSAAYESLAVAKERIVKGTSIIILPEGTRSRTGELGEFKRGAFWLAQHLGLPLLPVTLDGTRRVLPARSLDLFPGTVRMVIHPPIEPDNRPFDDIISEVRARIQKGLSCCSD